MSFWKLVGAIIVGNLLTALVVTALWLVFLASFLGHARDAASSAGGADYMSATDMNSDEINAATNQSVNDADNALNAATMAVENAQKAMAH